MAAPSYTTDLTTLDDADSATNWAEPTASGWTDGSSGPDADAEYGYIQGANGISQQMTKTGICGMFADNGTGTGGHGTDGAYLVWMLHTVPTALATYANGGMRIMVGSALNTFYSWDVGGSDRAPNPKGGWGACYAVNTSMSADDTLGGYTGGTERYVGSALNVLTAISKGNVHVIDAIRYGRCELRVNGGDGTSGYATFAGMAAKNDANDATDGYNSWGLFTDISGGAGVYQSKGRIRLGYSSAVDFRDSNVTILIEDTPKCTANFNYISVEQATSNIAWTNITFIALGSQSPGYFAMLDDAPCAKTNCAFIDMGSFIYDSNSTILGTTFLRCGQITPAGADMTGSIVSGYTGSADTSALVWNEGTNPDGYLDEMRFTMGANDTHAIEFGTSSPTTLTLNDIVFTGYTNSVGSSAAPLYIARDSGMVTVTANGCSGITSSGYKSAGATVNIVTGTVTVQVHAIDAIDFSDVVGARILVYADTGGDLFSGVSVSITRSGSTATVSHASHGLSNGDIVMIKGTNETEYRGVFTVSNVTGSTYDYTVTGTPDSPATGSPTSTYVILDGITDSNGEIKDTAFIYTFDQPVAGRVRRGTSIPRYKPAPITGDIVSTGFSYTAVMIRDE